MNHSLLSLCSELVTSVWGVTTSCHQTLGLSFVCTYSLTLYNGNCGTQKTKWSLYNTLVRLANLIYPTPISSALWWWFLSLSDWTAPSYWNRPWPGLGFSTGPSWIVCYWALCPTPWLHRCWTRTGRCHAGCKLLLYQLLTFLILSYWIT